MPSPLADAGRLTGWPGCGSTRVQIQMQKGEGPLDGHVASRHEELVAYLELAPPATGSASFCSKPSPPCNASPADTRPRSTVLRLADAIEVD